MDSVETKYDVMAFESESNYSSVDLDDSSARNRDSSQKLKRSNEMKLLEMLIENGAQKNFD